MDLSVKTVPVNEHQLFNFSQFTDDLLKTEPEVKDAGVFKVLLDNSIKGQGTSLSDLIAIGKSHGVDMVAKKQSLLGFSHCPNVYGHRAYNCEIDDNPGCVKDIRDVSRDQREIHDFITASSDQKSYNTSTCCSAFLEDGLTDSAVRHFYSEVVPRMASIIDSPSNLNKLLKRGKSDAKSLNNFTNGMLRLPMAEREALIVKCLLKDKREEPEFCTCPSCKHDDAVCLKDVEGVIYGSGVSVNVNDCIKISPHFGLYGLASTSLLRLLEHQYEGITLPYLYYGSTHSFFPAHIEDNSLFSLNFLHYGQPKIWIVVPPRAVQRVHDCFAESSASLVHSTCRNLLSHKYFVPTPMWLEANKIPFKVVIQNAGEGVIVCPNAVHFGFNSGYNVAEACNFATTSWVPFGMVALKCTCLGGEVHFNMERMIAAVRPDLLQAYINNTLPEGEDPCFYDSILRKQVADVPLQRLKMGSAKDSTQMKEVEEEHVEVSDSEDIPFPDLPTKTKGRKVVACPKLTCAKIFKAAKKMRVEAHIRRNHKHDSSYQNLLDAVRQIFPDRNKCKKIKCNRCGKLIAGRGAQMRMHQDSAGCRKN